MLSVLILHLLPSFVLCLILSSAAVYGFWAFFADVLQYHIGGSLEYLRDTLFIFLIGATALFLTIVVVLITSLWWYRVQRNFKDYLQD